MANTLTPERLFAEPALRLAQPSQFKISPCGNYVSFLQPNDTNTSILDLWIFDRTSEQRFCLLAAATLADEEKENISALSPTERAERERRRQFTQGITEYFWRPNTASVVACIDGQAFLADIEQSEPSLLTNRDKRQAAFSISPNGEFLSYVRNGDLYYLNLSDPKKAEHRTTDDASATLSNGAADFLAAEEMHRFKGHWWSNDESLLFFSKVDESKVEVSNRLEVDANGSRTIAQRYPYAGAINPTISLWQHDLATGKQQEIWRDNPEQAYLARVNATASGLYIQCQDRLQQTLVILHKSYTESQWHTFHAEHSTTWINLTDDFIELPNGGHGFTTESNGRRQIILINQQSAPKHLAGPTHINQLIGADGEHIYACGWQDAPIENHLFAIPLDGGGFVQITSEPGWHDFSLNALQGLFLDRFTSDKMPLRVQLNTIGSESEAQVLFDEQINSGHPYHPFAANHVACEFGSVVTCDQQDLHFRLTPPLSPVGKHPVIVYVYGGPGAQKVRKEWSPLLLQLFAHYGFGVLELDNRGSNNRGRDFEAPIYQAMGSVEVEDQLLGIELLKSVPWADIDNIGIFGHSYGGYMTLMSLCKAPGIFKAGAAVAPVSDWALYDSHYTERYMGLPQDNPEAYKQSGVIAHLDKLANPLLLMHGMADDNVLFTHSTLIMSELQKLGKQFELMTYPGAKHSMQEAHVSTHRFSTILNFFARHLKRGTNVEN
jgi:dipeptidyl-peptidase-4